MCEPKFVNKQTKQATMNHGKAMEWFRAGATVELYTFNNKSQKWDYRTEWIH